LAFDFGEVPQLALRFTPSQPYGYGGSTAKIFDRAEQDVLATLGFTTPSSTFKPILRAIQATRRILQIENHPAREFSSPEYPQAGELIL
jgi:hypothetical protein